MRSRAGSRRSGIQFWTGQRNLRPQRPGMIGDAFVVRRNYHCAVTDKLRRDTSVGPHPLEKGPSGN